MTSNVSRKGWWWLRPQFRISRRISWNICRVMATSGWKITERPSRTTFAPILMRWSAILLDRLQRRQRAQEIAEVVGERMKLEPHRIGGERSARQSRPLHRAFALLDPLLARPALVVESSDALGLAAHVR